MTPAPRRFLVLACGSMARLAYAAAATCDAVATVEVLEQGLHDDPRELRRRLQQRVAAVEPGEYDTVLLAYGLCGGAAAGLLAGAVPLVMPRAHDCITLYLGDRSRFDDEFAQAPGTMWLSRDYLERRPDGADATLGAGEAVYRDYVERYGQDNADYLVSVMAAWSQHYRRVVHLGTGSPGERPHAQRAADLAAKRSLHLEQLPIDGVLVVDLLAGRWDHRFLVVPPGQRVTFGTAESIVSCTHDAGSATGPGAHHPVRKDHVA